MKKLFFVPALLALATLTFTACGSDDDDNGGTDISSIPVMDAPAYADDAMELTPTSEIIYELNGDRFILNEIQFTESGDYLLKVSPFEEAQNAKTRVYATYFDYIYGTYTKRDDNTFNLSDWGSISITSTSGNVYTLDIRTLSGEQPSAEVRKVAKSAEGIRTSNLCRTWTIGSTELSMKSDDSSASRVGKRFTDGCNLKSITDYIRSYANLDDDFDSNHTVKKLIFTSSGRFIIVYGNGRRDVGRWSWKSEKDLTITYSWDDDSMGTSFTNGEAAVSFSDRRICTLGLGGQVRNSEGKTWDVTMLLRMTW